ncbi:TRAP transporter small permease [Nereida sp. MMG025]|uniref:TRAP transporter small permease n=1 Tax=Nereida sp. MMG025 TaxID=2909981 RepID=UPI001F1E788E|nr:TRAP transporter small permease [Nereida sp. MMG025]MCF6445437.1 TRAP transporter small permease [Nereida sp. MMG025]
MPIAKRAQTIFGARIETMVRWLAYAGGFILVALALVTVASITTRQLFNAPIRGDYEIVANGCALAVFAFLPLCHYKRGHVSVDIVVDRLPDRLKAVFGLIGDVLIAGASLLILRQLWFGFGEKFPYGSETVRQTLGMGYKPYFAETTYELQIPVWIPYGLALIGAAIFAVTALYCVWRALNWVLEGQEPHMGL